MTSPEFPNLRVIGLAGKTGTGGQPGGRLSAEPLQDAAGKLTEVRDYLFEAEQPTSPENLVRLRGLLEDVYRHLTIMITFNERNDEIPAGEHVAADGSADLSSNSATDQGIRQAAEATREAVSEARTCTQVMKLVADDWEVLRADLDRSPENRRAHYRSLLDSQQDVENSLSIAAGHLQKFVNIVNGIGRGGSGSNPTGRTQHGRTRGQVMEGRPHYRPFQPENVEWAS